MVAAVRNVPLQIRLMSHRRHQHHDPGAPEPPDAMKPPIGAERVWLKPAVQARARAAGRDVAARPDPRRAEPAFSVTGEPVRLR
jgi:hypothetical protein